MGEPIDWEKWRLKDKGQELWVWVALFTAINPDEMNPTRNGFAAAKPEFRRLLEIAEAAEGLEWTSLDLRGGPYHGLKREDFIRWAEQKGFPVPDGLQPPKVPMVEGIKALQPYFEEILGEKISSDTSALRRRAVSCGLIVEGTNESRDDHRWTVAEVKEKAAAHYLKRTAKK